MNIPIGNKLNSSNLSQIIEKYWDLSLKSNSVTFDFSNTEWISNSEFVFLINWINNLTNMSIVVGIQLPKDNGIGILERKKRFQNKILFDWEIRKYFGNKIKVYKGDISNVENRRYSNNEIIKIPIIDYSPEDFDKSFAELFNLLNLNSFSILTKELTSLNHLESELLNFAITKELYSNTVIHSGLQENSECIYSFSINKKISDNKANRKNLEEREKELSNLEKSFFLDEGKYRNIDFVEINFQDFGYGIVKTLKEKYYNDKDHLKNYFEDEYELHESTNEDSQILHYALLLFTSKYEVDKRFEVHDFIPRGLYILQELVAKYQGYLEIFSGSGAIGISYFQGKKTIQFAKKNNVNRIFPGTRIRIVFPSKESILKLRPSKIPHITEKYENKVILINLIELLCKTKFDFIPDISLNNIEKKITLLSIFFDSFSKIFFNN